MGPSRQIDGLAGSARWHELARQIGTERGDAYGRSPASGSLRGFHVSAPAAPSIGTDAQVTGACRLGCAMLIDQLEESEKQFWLNNLATPHMQGNVALLRTDEEAMSMYLDVHDLTTLLGQSTRSIRNNLAERPHLVPPKMHIPYSRMLRWRAHEVESWMFETGFKGRSTSKYAGPASRLSTKMKAPN